MHESQAERLRGIEQAGGQQQIAAPLVSDLKG